MKRLATNAAFLAGAQLASQAIGFGMLALVARAIGPGNLGAYAVASTVVGYIGVATTLGLPVVGMREAGTSGYERVDVLRETVLVRLALAVIGTMACIVWGKTVLGGSPTGVLLSILSIKLLFEAVTVDWYIQGLGRHQAVAAARVTGQIAYAALLIVVLTDGFDGAKRYSMANVVGTAVTAGILALIAMRDAKRVGSYVSTGWGAWKASRLRRRLIESMPFLWWITVTQVYYSTDILLVGVLAGNEEAGLYAAAAKVPLSIIALVGVWFGVAMPEIARLHALGQHSEIRRQTSASLTAAAIVGLPCVLVGPFAASRLVTLLFGTAFTGASPALAVLTASMALSFLQVVMSGVIMGTGRERPYVRAMAGGAGLNVALNFLLVPHLGGLGAAISTMITEAWVVLAGAWQIRATLGLVRLKWTILGGAVATGLVSGLVCIAGALLGRPDLALALAVVVYALTIAGLSWRDREVRAMLPGTSR